MDPASIKQQKSYQSLYDGLSKSFKFKPFNIFIRYCGIVNAYSNPDIHMCRELQDDLQARGVAKAWLFVLFHELGHTLVRLWGIPGHGSEDLADEFATYILVLTGQHDIAKSAAVWFINSSSRREALNKMAHYDRHTLSIQRARNILVWLKQKDDLIQRWNKVMISNMTKYGLLDILENPDKNKTFDAALAKKELRSRGIAIPKTTSFSGFLKEAIYLSAATRTAIDVFYSEGYKLGEIPSTPAKIGLANASSYHSKYVKSVSYTSSGKITVTLSGSKSLAAAANKTIVLVPVPKTAELLYWHYDKASTLDPKYWPKGIGIKIR